MARCPSAWGGRWQCRRAGSRFPALLPTSQLPTHSSDRRRSHSARCPQEISASEQQTLRPQDPIWVATSMPGPGPGPRPRSPAAPTSDHTARAVRGPTGRCDQGCGGCRSNSRYAFERSRTVAHVRGRYPSRSRRSGGTRIGDGERAERTATEARRGGPASTTVRALPPRGMFVPALFPDSGRSRGTDQQDAQAHDRPSTGAHGGQRTSLRRALQLWQALRREHDAWGAHGLGTTRPRLCRPPGQERLSRLSKDRRARPKDGHARTRHSGHVVRPSTSAPRSGPRAFRRSRSPCWCIRGTPGTGRWYLAGGFTRDDTVTRQ